MNKVLSFLFFSVFMTNCGEMNRLPILASDTIDAVIHPIPGTKFIPNTYIVTFKNYDQQLQSLHSHHSYFYESKLFHNTYSVHNLSDERIEDIDFITAIDVMPKTKVEEKSVWEDFPVPKTLLTLRGGGREESPKGVIAVVKFTSQDQAKEVLKEWEDSGRIWFAEPDWVSETTGVFDDLNTSYSNSGYHWIDSMQIPQGFKHIADRIAAGTLNEEQVLANAPVIAVMDSGVDWEHPAFEGRIWENESPGESDCIGDVHGCDLTFDEKGYLGTGESIYPFGLSGTQEPCAEANDGADNASYGNCQHGTHVAGIVAGRIEEQSPGTCPICQIMVLKVVDNKLQAQGGISDSAIIKGMKYITRFVRGDTNAIRIINMSLSKFQRSRAVALLVNQLKNHSKGTLLVGAAGNEDTSFRSYPAALNDALAVASVEDSLKKASYSNFGLWVDIAAPGGNGGAQTRILSAVPGGQTASLNGTSMAAPMVAGIAGMMLAVEPSMSVGGLRSRLIAAADPVIYDLAQNDGYNASYYKYISVDKVNVPLLGSGRVDLLATLTGENQGIVIDEFINTRVDSSLCGVVGDSNRSVFGWFGFLMVFVAPLAVGGLVAVQNFQKSHYWLYNFILKY